MIVPSPVAPDRLPQHVAIIMDGNGRWAVRQGLERVAGHQQGARTVKRLVTHCADLRRDHGRPEYLTLYSFSLENWKRPVEEVAFLMQMYIDYLRDELPTMTRYMPGSTTKRMSPPTWPSFAGVRVSSTVFVWPGPSDTRRKSFSSLIGRVGIV